MNESQRRAWLALDLGPDWAARASAPPSTPRPVSADGSQDDVIASSSERSVPTDIAAMDWPALRDAVTACRQCALCETRSQTVFGVGDPAARWLFIGEAPGAEEDVRGEPFVGQAGKLLDAMLAAIGLDRQHDVFIANVLKCRPPGNRNPEPGEVARCAPFLRRQIALVRPSVIVAMGRFAVQSLLGREDAIATLRGQVHRYASDDFQTRLVVTYHPAYLLRNLADKSKVWADLCLARGALESTTESVSSA